MDRNSGIDKAIAEVGSAEELAKHLGVWRSAISQMRTGQRPVPAERAVQIEKIPGVTVTRIDLRPHDWWKLWPELADKHPDLIPKEVA